jgi:uncharacterized membrane protein YkoI
MSPQLSKRSRAGIALAGVGVAALAFAGVSYAASTSGTTATPSDSATATPAPDGDHAFDPGGPDPVRDDEQSVEAGTVDTLTAAALEEVPGATVIRVETDGDGAAYEVHLTTSDGTLTTVKFDESLSVVEVQDGMGAGGRGGRGHNGDGDGDGDGPDAGETATPDSSNTSA